MKMLVRLTIVAGLLMGTLCGVTWACPDWATQCGLDVWNLSEYERSITESQRYQEGLSRVGDAVGRRMQHKLALIDDLIAGRESFRDVVLQFWVLNHQQPNIMASIRNSSKGRNDVERMGRNVIGYVMVTIQDNPTLVSEWKERLELELQLLMEDPELAAMP